MEQKRIVWLDYARTFAIFCVVICHAAETYYRPVYTGEATVSTGEWILLNTLFTLGRMGVPIFLGLTGTLMLSRELDVRTFYVRHLLPLFLTTEIWCVLNYLFCNWMYNRVFEWKQMVSMMLFLEPNSLSHMWYMPMILSFYVVMPFLSRIVQRTNNEKEYRLWMILSFLVFVGVPTANVFFTEAFAEISTMRVQLETTVWGGVYLLYMFIGYRIGQKETLRKVPTVLIALPGIVAVVLNTLCQRYLHENGFFKARLLSYNTAGIFIAGICTFELLRRIFYRKKKCSLIVKTITNTSFGIFLLHKPIQVYFERKHMELLVAKFPLFAATWTRILLLFLVSFLVSYLIVLVVTLILPPVGKLLFYSNSFYKKRERR